MYLSIIQLTNSHAQYHVDMHDGNVIHKFLTYIQDNNRQDEELLYYYHSKILYVQTKHPINAHKLPRFGMLLVDQYNVSDVIQKLHPGVNIRFKIRVSPLAQKAHTKNKVTIINPHEQIDWLYRKMYEGGAKISHVKSISRECIVFKKSKQCKIHTVTFVGEASILNVNQFAETVRNGIGKHKNYGTGLLNFRPII